MRPSSDREFAPEDRWRQPMSQALFDQLPVGADGTVDDEHSKGYRLLLDLSARS